MNENQAEKRTRGRPPSSELLEIPGDFDQVLADAGFYKKDSSRDERWRNLPDASIYDRKYRIRAAIKLALRRFSSTGTVADLLGKSWPQIKRYMKSGDMPASVMETLATAADVPHDWIATGNPKGGMETLRTLEHALASEGRHQGFEKEQENQLRNLPSLGTGNFGVLETNPEREHLTKLDMRHVVLVPRYEVRAATAGGTNVFDEPEAERVPFHRILLRGLRCDLSDLAMIEVQGDSMEPTLAEGEPILIDRTVDRISRDSIYVFRLDDELLVKRIQRGLDGSLTVISDNPRYQPQKLTPELLDQITVIGEVVWPTRR